MQVSCEFSKTWSAWPGVLADSCMMDCWRGDITWASRAAGRPPCQVGSRISAGLDMESGVSPLASRVGPRAADWAAENKTSRMALWRVILSPSYMVIAKLVGSEMTCRADVGVIMEVDAEPVSQTAAELSILHVYACVGRGWQREHCLASHQRVAGKLSWLEHRLWWKVR